MRRRPDVDRVIGTSTDDRSSTVDGAWDTLPHTFVPSIARHAVRALGSAAALGLLVLSSGCAGTSGWDFADEPGVPVDITLERGGTISGTLVELSGGAFVVDTSVDRGENVRVVRKDGVDYVYVDDVITGTAVEVRDYDIVTRERISPSELEGLSVEARGYLGWGTAIAGVLAFFLVKVLQDVEY
jgi:hypothetical protein